MPIATYIPNSQRFSRLASLNNMFDHSIRKEYAHSWSPKRTFLEGACLVKIDVQVQDIATIKIREAIFKSVKKTLQGHVDHDRQSKSILKC